MVFVLMFCFSLLKAVCRCRWRLPPVLDRSPEQPSPSPSQTATAFLQLFFGSRFCTTEDVDVHRVKQAKGSLLNNVLVPTRPVRRLESGLAEGSGFLHSPGVALPDLRQLEQGDADAWDEAFRWLWPVAFEAARLKLSPFLPADVEDVAIESLEELVQKVREVGRTEELRPLLASIAHHRAVSRLREHFAAKRGGGQTTSLQATTHEDGAAFDPPDEGAPLA